MIRAFIFLFFLAFGLGQVFGGSWIAGGWGERLLGDLGDVRFNILVLEHTWRWFQGLHPSLFDMPMFAPSPHVYAFSDLWFGLAPIYWFLRSGIVAPALDMYGAYEGLMISGAILNFASFYFLAQSVIRSMTPATASGALSVRNTAIAAFGAYLFSFGLIRQSNVYHPQLWSQFWVVVSAIGLWLGWVAPARDLRLRSLAPWLFVGGAALQFVTAFYFFWFWIWTLSVLATVLAIAMVRASGFTQLRRAILNFVRQTIVPGIAFAGLVSPFLFRYLAAARLEGRFGAEPHSWVAIVATVPKVSSWWRLPEGHWQANLFSFLGDLKSLPMWQEHVLGSGFFTSLIALVLLGLGVRTILKEKWSQTQVLALIVIPLLAMFFFTLASGRVSPWALVTYLFPAGQVIRAVGRIQIFMLLFWALLGVWAMVRFKARSWMWLGACVVMVAETLWQPAMTFTRTQSEARIAALEATGRAQIDAVLASGGRCDYLYYPQAFLPGHETENIDAVFASWRLGFTTVNGYSGRNPRGYANTANELEALMPNLRGCSL